MSKGGSRQAAQTVTSYNVPDYILSNQEEVFQRAREFSPEVYQGARFAPTNPYEQQQIQALSDFGMSQGARQYQDVIGGLLGSNIGSPDLLRAEYERDLSPAYLNQVIQDRVADVTGDVTSRYAGSGRLGSAAFGQAFGRGIGQAVAPLLAQQEMAEAERRANLANQIIQAERGQAGLQAEVAGMIPTAQNLLLQQMGATGTAGELQRAIDERTIQAEQARIAEENAARASELNALLSAAGAATTGIGQTTTSYQPTGGTTGGLLGAGLIARTLMGLS
jgi:hypothetical protein